VRWRELTLARGLDRVAADYFEENERAAGAPKGRPLEVRPPERVDPART